MDQSSPDSDSRVLQAFLELLNSQDEFPLNVEGAKTMPYSSSVASIDQGTMQIVLKMIRPLPAQLPAETPCRVSIGALGEHWKAMLLFQNRYGHLQYLFNLPKTMEKAGRREHKRYTFRPRENVYVYVQDANLPGLSASGQLFDLSIGGCSFRPDRAFRIEDGARLKLDTAMFERGKSFPIIRIDGLPKLKAPLRLRGTVAHVGEKKSIIFVAFVFGMLDSEEEETLIKALEAREKMGNMGGAKGPEASSPESAGNSESNTSDSKIEKAGTNIEPDDDALDQLERELHPPPPTVLRLARRTCSLLLIKQNGEKCMELIRFLKTAGYVRITQCESIDSHIVQTTQNVNATLVALESGGDPEDAINSFRKIHEKTKGRKELKHFVVSDQFEPILLQSAEEFSLPIGFTSDPNWIEKLDQVIGLLSIE
ncbi:MAG: PilZ domain-containing protein [Holophagaceae bacterium]|nr:PilZ domain-containing protein [Holophagaceae bacterium]